MEDLQSQLDEITTTVDEHGTSIDDHGASIEDHEGRIGTTEEVTSQIDPLRINQLNFPLDQDTIDLIKGVFPTGTVTLAGGTATVTDTRIGSNALILYSVKTSNVGSVLAIGAPYLNYSYVVTPGQVVFTSTIGSDTSTLVYVLLNTQ